MALVNGNEVDTGIQTKTEGGRTVKVIAGEKQYYCNGFFAFMNPEDFQMDSTQRYSDNYILGKGLWEKYGGVLDESGIPMLDDTGAYARQPEETEETEG